MSYTASPERLAFDSLADAGLGWLNWIQLSSDFEKILNKRIPWDELNGQEKGSVKAKLAQSQPSSQLLLNALYVTLVAGFEEFLRGSVRRLATNFNESKHRYADVTRELLHLNLRESARLLSRIDSPPDYIQINEEDFCRRLGTCCSTAAHVEFNDEAFGDIEGLIKLENFFRRVSAFKVVLSWDELGKDQKIKNALGLGKSSTRDVSNALKKAMVEVARIRNRIAHMGGNASDVTEGLLKQHTTLLQQLAEVLDLRIPIKK